MPYTTDAKNLMIDYAASLITHVSLHTGRPTMEANELSVEPYRRELIRFSLAEGGEVASERSVRINVPPGVEITHAGFWTASSGGTMLAWGRVPKRSFRGRGVYELDLVTLDLNLESE